MVKNGGNLQEALNNVDIKSVGAAASIGAISGGITGGAGEVSSAYRCIKDVKLAEKLYRLNIWRFVCLRGQQPGTLIDPDGRISISWAIRPVEKIFANAVAKAGSKTAAKAAPCAADGPLPIGEIISGIWTLL